MRRSVYMENPKKIIIIGAGIAGLSAGIYAQKNGFISEIFEKNPNNGGLCTSWVRKNHVIDGCVHWLTGTKENTDINQMWHDVDAFDQEDIIRGDNFGSIEYEGKVFTFWNDLDKLEKEMLEISPKDKRRIRKTKKYIIKFFNMPLPVDKPMSTMNIFDFIKIGFSMLPYLPAFLYAINVSQSHYANKFKSKYLRYVMSRIVPGDGNLYASLYAYGTVALGNGGVPRGGSSYLIKRMVNEYLRCGGVIHNNSEVKELLMKKKEVIGIKLENGKQYTADYYITSCDAFEATRKFLKNKHQDNRIVKRFIKKEEYPLPSCVYVSFLVDQKKLKELNLTTTYEFPCEPLNIATRVEDSIKIRDYSFDPMFVGNDGRVLLNVLIHQNDKDFYYWKNLHSDYKVYLAKKMEIANEIKDRIEKHFPSLKGELEIIDVCTAMTYKRYVNAHRGAYMPWSFTARGSQLLHNSKLSGIKNLIFSGQWTIMPGGLPIALMSGKFAIQILSKKEHKPVMLLNNLSYK